MKPRVFASAKMVGQKVTNGVAFQMVKFPGLYLHITSQGKDQ